MTRPILTLKLSPEKIDALKTRITAAAAPKPATAAPKPAVGGGVKHMTEKELFRLKAGLCSKQKRGYFLMVNNPPADNPLRLQRRSIYGLPCNRRGVKTGEVKWLGVLPHDKKSRYSISSLLDAVNKKRYAKYNLKPSDCTGERRAVETNNEKYDANRL